MIGETYRFTCTEYIPERDVLYFTFVSKGRKNITKVVYYSPSIIYGPGCYLLGFGDLESGREKEIFSMDDGVNSNNGDTKKVLYTVVSTLRSFFDIHPEAHVVIMGSDEQRGRVYEGLIGRQLNQIEQTYSVNGVWGDVTERFIRGREYVCVIISLKKHNKNENRT